MATREVLIEQLGNKTNAYDDKIIIDWDDVSTLITSYNSNARMIYRHGSNNGPNLDGFSFPVKELKDLLATLNDTQRVYFAIGFHTINPSIPNQNRTPTCQADDSLKLNGGYTIIAVGMNNDCTLKNDASKGDLIYDYCDPCPPRCPR
ncbi:MAG: hypothetical protein HRT58_13930 [Crocinitomicaceae bacterium]|nr:hypothetical protein [Flavobacteriales bacterium]NQZ36765.1 hypothetical protein [Crocinitomicaceae bacterium]